jgi:alkanesulfonate monooxygenase SsuD/methylene tetrahydromethanopterin reductase-like flavin-dependent oxidoreductase (luciferase family)
MTTLVRPANNTRRFLQLRLRGLSIGILKRHYQGRDLSGYSLDDVAPPVPADTNPNKSRLKLGCDLASRNGLTLRELCLPLATARGHRTVADTPAQIADAIREWFTAPAGQ